MSKPQTAPAPLKPLAPAPENPVDTAAATEKFGTAGNVAVLERRPETKPMPEQNPEPISGLVPETARDDTSEPQAPQAFAPSGAHADTSAAASAGTPSRKKLLLGAAGLLALIAAATYAYHYITIGRFIVSTDDAYVGADMTILSPKIAANVVDVPIVENQHVRKGDVLVRLDASDDRLALDQARAKLSTQQAAIATFVSQLRVAQANLDQAKAQLDATTANVVKAEADFNRVEPLAEKSYSSQATLDSARATRDAARAQAKANEAAIETAKANIALLDAQRKQAIETAAELQVAVNKAEHDLTYTTLRAPFDGVIGNKNVQVGDYVTPGQRLAAVVPLDHVYIDANLKETQLARVKPGEPVSIYVDALGGSVEGTVESLSPASGSQFSLLPPENATGNFTKIVQRVPVRISVPEENAKGRLRPGLSVVVDIDTRDR